MFNKTETLIWQDRFIVLICQGIRASFSKNLFGNGQNVFDVLARYEKPRVVQGGELTQYSLSTFMLFHQTGTGGINHLPKAHRSKISYEKRKYSPTA